MPPNPKTLTWKILKNIYTSKKINKNLQIKYIYANLDSIKDEIKKLSGKTVNINKSEKKVNKERLTELAKYNIPDERNILYYRLKEIKPEISYTNSSKVKLQNYFLGVNRKINDINNQKEGEYSFDPKAFKMFFRNIIKNPEFSYIVILNNKEYKTLNNIEISKEDLNTKSGSDLETSINYDAVKSLVVRVSKKKRESRKAGAFFPYFNKTDINLERYGIFNNTNSKQYENCLYNSLITLGIKKSTYLNETFLDLATKTSMEKIPTTYLKNIAKNLKINLIVNIECSNGNEYNVKHKYGEEDKNDYFIGLIAGHYFINEKTKYTKKFLIEKIIESGIDIDINTFFKKDERIKKNLSSFSLIRYMLYLNNYFVNEPFFKSIDFTNCVFQSIKKNTEITDLSYDEKSNLKKIDETKTDYLGNDVHTNFFTRKVDDEIINEPYKLAFFDFEAYVDQDKEEKYTPYMVSISYEDSDEVFTFSGEHCVINFLKSLRNNTMLIAHNLAYDLQFVIPYLNQAHNFIRLGNKVMTCSGMFYNKDTQDLYKLFFKDSYSMISSKLSSFPKMFNLQEMEKEILPYDLYNKKTTSMKYTSILEAFNHIKKDEDKIQFQNNLNRLKLLNPDNDLEFDIMNYAKYYCERDVKILKQGYLTFRKWIIDLCNLNIEHIISSASLAYKYMIKNNCLLDTYMLSGVPRVFIQKCVVGGRVMCKNNEKQHTMHELNDFDAVSLYPSAMSRLKGFLKGAPKVIKKFEPSKYDGYYIQIRVKKVGKHLNFPLLSYVDDNGIRQFSNDLCDKIIYVDNIALEDAVKYQQLEYEFIRGYYYNDGFNTSIVSFIKKVFNERLRLKAEKNPAEQVYKLIMNSCYGKLIQKESKYDESFIYGEEKFHSKFEYNDQDPNMISATKIREGMYIISKKAKVGNHFASPHLGVQVLSMSKRIMNEVMTLAEDNDIDIYYQDTDSMHIDNDKINELSDLFKHRYNRELIGKNLGQFHSDFDFKSDTEPVAVESIFLGKKSYIDKVKLVKDGEVHYDYHIRMKGIPSACIKEKFYKYTGLSAKQIKKETPLDLYKNLFNGESVKYDLSKFCVMKRNKDFSYEKINTFFRELKF